MTIFDFTMVAGSNYGESTFSWTQTEAVSLTCKLFRSRSNHITADDIFYSNPDIDTVFIYQGSYNDADDYSVTAQIPNDGTWYYYLFYVINDVDQTHEILMIPGVAPNTNIYDIDAFIERVDVTRMWESPTGIDSIIEVSGRKYIRCRNEIKVILKHFVVPPGIGIRLENYGGAQLDYDNTDLTTYADSEDLPYLSYELFTPDYADGNYDIDITVGIVAGGVFETLPTPETSQVSAYYDNTPPVATIEASVSSITEAIDTLFTADVDATDTGLIDDGSGNYLNSVTIETQFTLSGLGIPINTGDHSGELWIDYKIADISGNYSPAFQKLTVNYTGELPDNPQTYHLALGKYDPGSVADEEITLPDFGVDTYLIAVEDIYYDGVITATYSPYTNKISLHIELREDLSCIVPKATFAVTRSDTGEILAYYRIHIAINGTLVTIDSVNYRVCNSCVNLYVPPVPPPPGTLVSGFETTEDCKNIRFAVDENNVLHFFKPDVAQVYRLTDKYNGSELYKLKIETIDRDVHKFGNKTVINKMIIRTRSKSNIHAKITPDNEGANADVYSEITFDGNYDSKDIDIWRPRMRSNSFSLLIEEDVPSGEKDVEVRGVEYDTN